jgi:hypothetical protein
MNFKKLFIWTPQDIKAWEAIRGKGLAYFILWYGFKISAAILFVLVGGGALLSWLIGLWRSFPALPGEWAARLGFLGLEMLLAGVLSLSGGLVNALATWALEEAIYRRIK